MELITHKIESNWGTSLYFMEKSGKAFARLYWFKDEVKTGYLCSLSVNEDCRNQGFGTYLQNLRETIAIELGMIEVRLWVLNDSWMCKWYERRGYIYHSEYSDTQIWMSKKLNN